LPLVFTDIIGTHKKEINFSWQQLGFLKQQLLKMGKRAFITPIYTDVV